MANFKKIQQAIEQPEGATKSMEQNTNLTESNPLLGFLEYLAEGVLVVDQHRVIRAANQVLERMLGWKAEELVGRKCQETLACQDLASAAPMCMSLCPILNLRHRVGDSREPFHELTLITKAGNRIEVSASFANLELPPFLLVATPQLETELEDTEPNSTPNLAIILLRDITEQKRQEHIKTQFIATASHQLRTPLASIKTASGLLLDSVGSDFSPPLMRLLQNIQESSLRIERLVKDMIELTNLQNGRIQLQYRRADVHEMVRQAVELNQSRLDLKEQQLELKLPPDALYMETDVGRIGQVLGHLISNASKFSGKGKKIVLEVSKKAEALRRPEIIFSVQDKGIGISAEEQPLIFEKFYQSQVKENSQQLGHGLGLPLAKALVELNGGRLWFESRPGKGSTFYFSLPAL
jgi:PAS domain S-box-containing protein